MYFRSKVLLKLDVFGWSTIKNLYKFLLKNASYSRMTASEMVGSASVPSVMNI